MFASRDAADGLDECLPRLQLLGEHAATLGGDLVEASAPFVGLFDPGAPDPATLLQAIEQWIQGIDVERQLSVGSRVDQLAELVAVPGARLEQREDQQLRGSSLQLTVERPRVYTCHRQIVCRQVSRSQFDGDANSVGFTRGKLRASICAPDRPRAIAAVA